MFKRTKDTKLFCDIKKILPDYVEQEIEFIESVVELEKETVECVFKNITDKNVNLFSGLIINAVQIRPLHEKCFSDLLKLVRGKFYLKTFKNTENELEKAISKIREIYYNNDDKIIKAIKEDDCELFIKLSSEPTFDEYRPIHVFDSCISNVAYDSDVNLIQLMAFFGSIKCFKVALMSSGYKLENVPKYAIAGGNSEIIHICEQKGEVFNNCFHVAFTFQRNDLCDWLLLHYESSVMQFLTGLDAYNVLGFFFLLVNFKKSEIKISLLDTCVNHYLHATAKYLVNNTCLKNMKCLHYAVKNGNKLLVKYLVNEGDVDINEEDTDHETPLSLAIKMNSFVLTKAIVKGGRADLGIRDRKGDTYLHIAAEIGNIDIVKILIEECHMEVDAMNNKSETPLYKAALHDHLNIVKYLIDECHADMNIKFHGKSLAMCIASYRSNKMLQFLLEESKKHPVN